MRVKTKQKTDLEKRIAKLGRVYFPDWVEDSIVKYNNCDDPFEREIIFREEIHPSIDKLAENIINKYKYTYIEGSFEDIKNQVVSFIVLTLHKYSKDKGKAFSYFSVVARNYLTANNDMAYKEEIRSSPIEEVSDVLTTKPEIESNKKDAVEFIDLLVRYWDYNLDLIFKKKRDRDIANAVVVLLKKANTIENFNKKALYLLIREMTDSKTVHITKVLNKMKHHVLKQMKEYRKTGYLKDPSVHFIFNKSE